MIMYHLKFLVLNKKNINLHIKLKKSNEIDLTMDE